MNDLVQLRVSAAEVMGFCFVFPDGETGLMHSMDHPRPIPNCPEDSNDALRLCGVMEENGFVPDIFYADGSWHAAFFDGQPGLKKGEVNKSFSLAITLAALRAMGKGEEKS